MNQIFKDNAVHCPKCDAVPHFQASLCNRPKNMSGHCLYLLFQCENGHKWEIHFEDHSGGIWINERNIN
jgi:hypothetical protein